MPTKIKKVLIGCPACKGTGFDEDGKFCPSCSGSGKIEVLETQSIKCPVCNGRGHNEQVPCPPCSHTGLIMIEEGAAKIAAETAEKQLQADNAALQVKLDDAFERGRQAAFAESGGVDVGKLQDQITQLKADKKALQAKLKA